MRKASLLYKRSATLFPLDASLKVQRGNMLKDCGRFDDARESYEAARALSPDDADIYLQLGHLAKLQGRLQEATTFYQRSSTLDPSRPHAADELARLSTGSWLDDWTTQITAPVTGAGPRALQAVTRPLRFLSAERNMLVLERLMVSFENRPR